MSIYFNTQTGVRLFKRRPCLKQEKFTFTHEKVVNVYIVYEKFVAIYCWKRLGAVRLNKNAEPDEYFCSEYGIGFDAHGFFFYLVVVGLVKME